MAEQPSKSYLASLIRLFYSDIDQLGSFSLVSRQSVPEPYSLLLAHCSHMTVTVESFHRDSVSVRVQRSQLRGDDYSREILLVTQEQGEVVQYGIVRLHLQCIAPAPKREILEEKKPLGRVLIEHQVLREVELLELWHIDCGPVLAHFFSVPKNTITFGRTAMIHCDGVPAIELLEIVRPTMPPILQ